MILELTILGILDADNYTPILILLLVLAKPQGGKDGFWFTIGVVATQMAGGFLFAWVVKELDGVSAPLLRWVAVYGQIGLGIALVVLGLLWRFQSRHETADHLSLLGHRPIAWLSIGIGIEVTKLITAVVYFDAVRRIISEISSLADQILLLSYFNFIAFLPMILIWFVYLFFGAASPTRMQNIQHWVITHEVILVRIALFGVGIFLVFNGYNFAKA